MMLQNGELEWLKRRWQTNGIRDFPTSISSAVIYLTSPSLATVSLTSSVNATGEKTARAPDRRRTKSILSGRGVYTNEKLLEG